MWGPTQNLGRIDLAVLTFIGYKQTNKHTDRQAKFIYRFNYYNVNKENVVKYSRKL